MARRHGVTGQPTRTVTKHPGSKPCAIHRARGLGNTGRAVTRPRRNPVWGAGRLRKGPR